MTRTRDKSTVSSIRYTDVDTTDSRSSTSYGTISVSKLDRMTDVVTNRFRKRSSKGEIIINPMTKQTTNPVVLPINYWKQRVANGSTRRWSRTHYAPWVNWTPWSDNAIMDEVARLEQLAITDAYAKVGEADVATLVELAELRETLSFLWSPARKMRDLTRRLHSYTKSVGRLQDDFKKKLSQWESLPPHVRKKRAKPEPPKLPKLKLGKFEATDISSAWLAYRYAIMPMVYTFQGIQKHLGRETRPERDTARAKKETEIDLEVAGTWTQYNYPNGNVWERSRRTGQARIKSRAGVLYAPDWSLNRQLGVQIHRVPMAMYEIIPLSFVTDWFHNGASVYDALTAELRSLKIHGAWVTSEIEFDIAGYLEAKPADPQTTCSGGGQATVVTGKWKRRRLASLADVRLALRVEMNGKRIADALALTHTMLATARKK